MGYLLLPGIKYEVSGVKTEKSLSSYIGHVFHDEVGRTVRGVVIKRDIGNIGTGITGVLLATARFNYDLIYFTLN